MAVDGPFHVHSLCYVPHPLALHILTSLPLTLHPSESLPVIALHCTVQMNLVRESNAHLRRENEELTSRLGALDKQLKQFKDAAAPFEEEARTVKADKEALEAANVQLLTDAHYWRDRCVLCVADCIL